MALTVAMIHSVVANIQNPPSLTGNAKSSRNHSKATDFSPSLRIIAPSGAVEVQRGGSVDIPIVMPPRMGASLELVIKTPPAYGDLLRLSSEPGAPICYRYLHRRESSEFEDTFSILVRDPMASNSGNLVNVKLVIRNPKADIVVDQEGAVDFGKVPLGCPVTRDLTLQNRYGSTFEERLLVDPPWRIDGDPAIRLAEGESRQVRIIFDPQATGSESTSLRIDNALVDFPQIILRGEGTAPFLIQDGQSINLSGEKPSQTLLLKNLLKTPVSVTLSGIPSMIRGDRHIELAPLGSGTSTLSIAGTEFAPDFLGKFRVTASSGTYGETINMQIIGPKAAPTLELLRGGDVLTGRVGVPLRLEGIARNSSDESRSVQLTFLDLGTTSKPALSTMVLPPKGAVNFHNDWISNCTGAHEVSVELREQGRLLDRKSWHVLVGVPQMASPMSAPPPWQAQRSDLVNPMVSWASEDFKQKLIDKLPPVTLSGWIVDHVTLRWRYYGSNPPEFRIQEFVKRNAISDRAGEQATDDWVDVKGLGPIKNDCGVGWSVRLPFLLPGDYTFRIVIGPNEYDEKKEAIYLYVSPWAFFWNPIRAVLIMILVLLIVRELRHRL